MLFLAELRQRFLGSLQYRQNLLSFVVIFHPRFNSNDFSSDTTMPVVTKFHMLPSGVKGRGGAVKSCSNCPGHMTNKATMPMYAHGQNLKNPS